MSLCFNLCLAIFHLSQAILYTLLASIPHFNATHIPLTNTLPTGRPGLNNTTFYVYPIGVSLSPVAMVAAFLYITSLFHCLRATKTTTINPFSDQPSTDQHLRNQIHTDRVLRWIEYSITSTLMLLAISLISGITQVHTLIAFTAANVAMIFLGGVPDFMPAPHTPSWTLFTIASFVGLLPWISIFIQVATITATLPVAPLVLTITITMFIFFFSFALNEAYYIFLHHSSSIISTTNLKAIELRYQILSALSKSLLSALTAAAMLT